MIRGGVSVFCVAWYTIFLSVLNCLIVFSLIFIIRLFYFFLPAILISYFHSVKCIFYIKLAISLLIILFKLAFIRFTSHTPFVNSKVLFLAQPILSYASLIFLLRLFYFYEWCLSDLLILITGPLHMP
jgi:hypothetical protein